MSDSDYSAKKCAKCKSILPLSSFNRNKSKPDGLGTECRACANAHSKKYHSENLSAHKLRGRAYYEKNKEYLAEWNAEYWRQRPEALKAAKAKYRERNREKIKEIGKRDWRLHNVKRLAAKKKYRQDFPHIGAAQVRARQTRKAQAMPAWADPIKIGRIYKACARIARVTGIKHHVDHYFPLKSDVVCGLHNEFNLRIITAFDNLSKGNNLISEKLCQP